jgi:hypothetical protein
VCVGVWVGGWAGIVCRQRCSLAGRQADENAWQTSRTHVKSATLRPLLDTAHCRMRRILQCGNGRTGANLPRERVDLGHIIFGISDEEVDATVDRVPIASSRVARVVFGAQTRHIGLARDDGRALAPLLVVEPKRGRRTDPSGRAQRECCKNDQTEVSSAKRGPHTPECLQGYSVWYPVRALPMCANACASTSLS